MATTQNPNDISLIIGEEATYGTSPVDGVKIPIVSTTIVPTQDLTPASEIDGTATNATPIQGIVSLAGDLTLRMRPKGFGYICQNIFGDPVTTGTDPYTHTFTPSTTATLSSTLEIDASSGLGKYLTQKGIKFGGLSVNSPETGQVDASVSAIGREEVRGAASIFTGTVTDLTGETEVFDAIHASVSAGTTFTTNTFDLTITKNIEAFKELDGTTKNTLVTEGKYDATATVNVLADSDLANVWTKQDAFTTDNVDFVYSDGTNSVTFSFDTVKWAVSGTPFSAGNTREIVALEMVSFGSFDVVVVNSQATY